MGRLCRVRVRVGGGIGNVSSQCLAFDQIDQAVPIIVGKQQCKDEAGTSKSGYQSGETGKEWSHENQGAGAMARLSHAVVVPSNDLNPRRMPIWPARTPAVVSPMP
jgi:hypothetical protein